MTTRAERKRNARRMVRTGYPVTVPFTRIEDVRAYLSGDTITCLLCGNEYRKLGMHITVLHDISVDEYRMRYSIPWGYSLAGEETRQLVRENLMRRIESGEIVIGIGCPGYEKLRTGTNRPLARTVLRQRGETIANWNATKRAAYRTLGREQSGCRKSKYSYHAPRGSAEFRQRMLDRPQTKNPAAEFRFWWRGKKQSEAHKQKRLQKKTNCVPLALYDG